MTDQKKQTGGSIVALVKELKTVVVTNDEKTKKIKGTVLGADGKRITLAE